MELLCNNDYGSFCLNVNDKKISLIGEGCKKPVRVYVFGTICEYAGLVLGDEIRCQLEYLCRFDPVKISLLDGRIDSDYKIIYEFILKNSFDFINVFNTDMLCECIKHFGHYVTFSDENSVIYAFPSDFFTHPVPEYQKYAYWYDVDLGFGISGYYFLGINAVDGLFFVNTTCLDNLGIHN